MMEQRILHYPNLKTVLMVEKTLKKAGQIMTKKELNDALENKVMWQTMEVILKYLEESGKIIIGKKGVLWIYNENPLMKKLKDQVVDF
jgi:sulfur transfer complex TusBCD TusB component (DsrH family)